MLELDSRLRAVIERVESDTGESFFRALVRSLGEVLEVDYALVSQLRPGESTFRTAALWGRGQDLDDVEVTFAGSPCEAVLGGASRHYPDALQQRFPAARLYADWGAVSFAGVPIFDSAGAVTGHVAVLHSAPLPNAEEALSIMRIFSSRVRAERERILVEEELRSSEHRLSALIESALDAIVVFDERGRILMFNPRAEEIFGARAEEVIGTSVRRFTSMKAGGGPAAVAALASGERRHAFTNPDTVARRANGEEFAAEATLSRVDIGGQLHFMVILRDVAERRREEENARRLQRQSDYLEEEIKQAHNFEEIVGRSRALTELLQQVDLVAETDSTVLILGESGTGKELIARAVHARSKRRDRPLVKVNCAALPVGLIESEMFGHEKGSFTGALTRHIGRFELAQRGTIFLDEIGELPLEVQAKLLRVLQDRELERVGGGQTIEVDVRIIAATNRDLARLSAEGSFRQDLFYRLNVFPLQLPPLRQRSEDIPALVHYFLRRYAAKIGRPVRLVAPETMQRLTAYPWPGNVRELENVIERGVILSRGTDLEIGAEILPAANAAAAADAEAPEAASHLSLHEAQRQHILEILEQRDWRIEGETGAARALGLSPSTLRSRMQKLGIRRPGAS